MTRFAALYRCTARSYGASDILASYGREKGHLRILVFEFYFVDKIPAHNEHQ